MYTLNGFGNKWRHDGLDETTEEVNGLRFIFFLLKITPSTPEYINFRINWLVYCPISYIYKRSCYTAIAWFFLKKTEFWSRVMVFTHWAWYSRQHPAAGSYFILLFFQFIFCQKPFSRTCCSPFSNGNIQILSDQISEKTTRMRGGRTERQFERKEAVLQEQWTFHFSVECSGHGSSSPPVELTTD